MLHEKINLGNSGYGTRDTILTTYVQNNRWKESMRVGVRQ